MRSYRRADPSFMPAPRGRFTIRGQFAFPQEADRRVRSREVYQDCSRRLGRFCLCNKAGLSISRQPAAPSVQPVHLDFLGSGPFCCKAPDYEPWILLDFLGFSRQNLDLSMGYADFSGKIFLALFAATLSGSEREFAVEAMRKRRIVHGASLTRFPIFCNQLSESFAERADFAVAGFLVGDGGRRGDFCSCLGAAVACLGTGVEPLPPKSRASARAPASCSSPWRRT